MAAVGIGGVGNLRSHLSTDWFPGVRFPVMKYTVLIEPVEESEGMSGFYYAHVPSLGITTHGGGIDGALSAAKDLISLWIEEMRASGESPQAPGESILATLEVA